MASLSELLEMPLTVSDVVIRIQLLLRQLADNVDMGGLKPEEMELYTFYLNRVFERNQNMVTEG
jgi:octanoyl-[GcvH]:protein N-octanoyltransferase